MMIVLEIIAIAALMELVVSVGAFMIADLFIWR